VQLLSQVPARFGPRSSDAVSVGPVMRVRVVLAGCRFGHRLPVGASDDVQRDSDDPEIAQEVGRLKLVVLPALVVRGRPRGGDRAKGRFVR
jgi:hypothetical protein